MISDGMILVVFLSVVVALLTAQVMIFLLSMLVGNFMCWLKRRRR